MKSNMRTLAVASALILGLAGAGAAYAHGTGGSQGSMMGQGMMGQGGQGGMMGMMNMMQQMSQMMETCNKMMQVNLEGDHPRTPGGNPPADDPAKDKQG